MSDTLTTAQSALIDEVRQWIEDTTDDDGDPIVGTGIVWNQNVWFKHNSDVWFDTVTDLDNWWLTEGGADCYDCGTSCCVAGYAVLQHRLNAPEDDPVFSPDLNLDIGEQAAELLGLSPRQSEWLFSEQRTKDEILASLREASTDCAWPLHGRMVELEED